MRRISFALICAGLLAVSGCGRMNQPPVEAAGNSAAAAAPAPLEVSVPAGTKIRVRLVQELDTQRNRAQDPFTATLDDPLTLGDRVIVPKGTYFYGHVTQSRPSGRFKGRAVLALDLDSFKLNGQTHEIQSTRAARVSAGHKKHHWLWIGGGSGGGALLGAIAGGGEGALIGAGAGAAAGTVGSALTGKRNVRMPAETTLTFTLQSPITLQSPATFRS